MNCPTCATENPAEAKYCINCGTSLAVSSGCPNCGAKIPAKAKFCPECGSQVGEAADPMRDRLHQHIPDELRSKLESIRSASSIGGERRTVTMLFCDVVGSTSAAERLDPEEWADIMNGAFEHLIPPVYRYEGTLAHIMGDAILAFFGAPIAHEDDAERAVLAALEIISGTRSYKLEVEQRWDVEFDVRVGINTGLVVVGDVGSDLRVEYTALGDAVNLAARLEQTAEPGTIQISADTHRLIHPLFEVEELGEISLKGKQEHVRTYRVVAPKARPGSTRGIEGIHSQLVGRDEELATLREAVQEVLDGRGAICTLVGEAGLGKSRLLSELHDSLQSEGLVAAPGSDVDLPIGWAVGRCVSYGTGTPYAPFIDLLSHRVGIDSGDTDDTARMAKIRSAVGRVLPDRVGDVAPYLGHLLGVELAGEDLDRVQFMLPPELRPRVFEAVAAFVAALASERPLVIVLEDLHWADSGSIDLAEHLMTLTDESMLLLIALFRPRREDLSWRFHEVGCREFPHRYTTIELAPLSDADGRALVTNLLQIEGLPERLQALILERAEGNPLYVEEMIRSLMDAEAVVRDGTTWRVTREIDDVAVPPTLTSLLVTRLDRLDDTAKLVAYTAAVIGREFSVETLDHLLDPGLDLTDALAELQRRELIHETSRRPARVYQFKHGLTQRTAYDSALLKTRREMHIRLAELLESSEPEAVQELARHWLGADEAARAVPYLVASGEQALGSYAIPEAIRYFRQAIDLMCDANETEIGRRAYEGLALSLSFTNDVDGAKSAAESLIEFGETRGDVATQVSGLNKLAWTVATRTGETDSAVTCLEQAEDLAKEVDDRAGLAEAQVTYCYLKTNEGQLESALVNQERAQELGLALRSPQSQAFGLVHYANTLVYLTRFEEAEEATAKARAFLEETGQKHYLAEVMGHTEAFLLMRSGRMAEAFDHAREGTELAASVGASLEEAMCAYTCGQAAQALGRWEEALAAQERALFLGQATGLGFLQSAALASLAVIHHSMGDAEQALSMIETVPDRMELPMGNALSSAALAEMGFCSLGLGDLDLAASCFERGLGTPSAASHLVRPMLLVGSGMVSLQQGDGAGAEQQVTEASNYALERKMQHMYPLTAFGRGQLRMAGGDPAGALDELSAGEAAARAIDMLPMAQMLAGAAIQAATAADLPDEAERAAERYRETVETLVGYFSDPHRRDQFAQSALAALA